MGAIVEKFKDAIGSMRYEGGATTALYWFIRVASILVPVLVVLCVIGLIYCKVNGIEINFPF